jgi:hypothetical protein
MTLKAKWYGVVVRVEIPESRVHSKILVNMSLDQWVSQVIGNFFTSQATKTPWL